MKYAAFIFFMLISLNAYAHHSRDHMMLLEDAEQVITSTQQGNEGGIYIILWTFVIILLFLGFIRWWKNRR